MDKVKIKAVLVFVGAQSVVTVDEVEDFARDFIDNGDLTKNLDKAQELADFLEEKTTFHLEPKDWVRGLVKFCNLK